MNNFQISPLFQKNSALKKEGKNLQKENRRFYIFIFCTIVIVFISVVQLGRNVSESRQLDYEAYTLSSAVDIANKVVQEARKEADGKQLDVVDKAASILAAADEEASEILKSAKEGK